jgi:hypothetical protein
MLVVVLALVVAACIVANVRPMVLNETVSPLNSRTTAEPPPLKKNGKNQIRTKLTLSSTSKLRRPPRRLADRFTHNNLYDMNVMCLACAGLKQPPAERRQKHARPTP